MALVIVSARVHADNTDAVAVETRRTFAAIAAAAPDVGYAVCRGPDGVTFVAILDAPEASNPLLAIPAFVEFQDGISAWVAEPPTSEVWEVIGSYGLFERADRHRQHSSISTPQFDR
jgi:hypothetical protein